MPKTLADLIESVASQFGEYLQGTATDGSTTTVEDTANFLEVDDYWNGAYLYVLEDAGGAGAAPEGEERAVIDYSQDDQQITVDPALTAAVAAGDTFELLPARRSHLVRKINEAIREAHGHWLVTKTDTTTITLVTDDYAYTLPTDLVELMEVLTRESSDEPYSAVPPRYYWVTGTPGAEELHFRAGTWWARLDTDQTVMLVYKARPSELAADTDELGLGAPAETELYTFILHWTLYLLHDQEANRRPAGKAYQAHYTQAEQHRQIAELIRGKATVNRPTGRWAGPNYPHSKG